MAKEIKRMKYFDGLFLKEQEFNLEQNYHIRMRRLHNRYLHNCGIVWGLEVNPGSGKAVTVSPGMALLRTAESEDEYTEEVSKEIILTEENPVDLDDPNYSVGTNVYIFISYSDVETDVEQEKGGDTEIHWEETAVIEHSLNIPENKVILARVEIVDNVDNPVTVHDTYEDESPLRKYAGFSDKILATENEIQVDSPLTINGDVGIGQPNDPKKLDVNGDLNINGQVDIVGIVKAASFEGDGSQLTGISKHSLDAADGDPVNAVYVDSDGNVGINTTTPSAKLDVNGDLNINGKVDISGDLNILRPGRCTIGEQLVGQINALTETIEALSRDVEDLKKAVYNPHTITGFEPQPVSRGEKLSISGENFDPVPENNIVIFFNGTPEGSIVTPIDAQSTRLTVIVPQPTRLTVIVPQDALGGPLSVQIGDLKVTTTPDNPVVIL